MFGTLKPTHAALGCAARRDWQQFYCGTCQGIGDQFGLPYRGLLSHDAVFLGLLVDGLQATAAPPDRTRCPILPVVSRPTVSPCSTAMRYAAAVQVLLAEQWAADRAIDGRTLARLGQRVLAGPAEQARATLAALGSDLAELIGFEQQQAAIEVRGHTTPAQAAEPTASALGLVFERIVALPGTSARSDLGEHLRALGRSVGSAIYLIDALEDLGEDLRSQAFNPCLSPRGAKMVIDAAKLRAATRLLQHARADIRTRLDALPLLRHRAVLFNILVTALGTRATQAIAQAEALDARDGRPLPLSSVWLKFAQTVAAMLIAIVGGTWSRLVRAATETGGSESESESETGGSETAADVPSTPDLPGETPPDLPADGSLDPGTAPDAGPCQWCCGDLLRSLCGGLGETCSGCGPEPCNGCSSSCGSCMEDCGTACSGCGSGCNACGDVCNDCGGTCSGCGDACSGCGDCGNACSGCGDCGNACSGCGNCGGGGCNC